MQEKGWLVEFTKPSLKSLERLEKKISARILNRLEKLAEFENPLQQKDVRSLEGKLKGYYRYRVGEYRIIFELDTHQRRIGILAVVPRGKGY
jgi:mRNA interferase RelE/StbE